MSNVLFDECLMIFSSLLQREERALLPPSGRESPRWDEPRCALSVSVCFINTTESACLFLFSHKIGGSTEHRFRSTAAGGSAKHIDFIPDREAVTFLLMFE